MPSCKEVIRMVSESLDRDLPLGRRIAIRLHFALCKVCALYKRQLAALMNLVHRAAEGFADCGSETLPAEARARMKQAIRKCRPGEDGR